MTLKYQMAPNNPHFVLGSVGVLFCFFFFDFFFFSIGPPRTRSVISCARITKCDPGLYLGG